MSGRPVQLNPEFRVLVCGGRDFTDRDRVYLWLDKLFAPIYPYDQEGKGGTWLPRPDLVLIHGACRTGVDQHAADWAAVNWVSTKEYPADWDKYGKAAGPIRNQQMLDDGKPDLVIAFPGGRGTADMVRQARVAKVPLLEIP